MNNKTIASAHNTRNQINDLIQYGLSTTSNVFGSIGNSLKRFGIVSSLLTTSLLYGCGGGGSSGSSKDIVFEVNQMYQGAANTTTDGGNTLEIFNITPAQINTNQTLENFLVDINGTMTPVSQIEKSDNSYQLNTNAPIENQTLDNIFNNNVGTLSDQGYRTVNMQVNVDGINYKVGEMNICPKETVYKPGTGGCIHL